MLGGTEKTGRRKRIKRGPQTRPLIVSGARSRVVEELVISAPMSRELRNYTRWAAAEARLSEDEAMVLTLDQAIGEFLRKDVAWQAKKKESEGAAEPEAPVATGPARAGEPQKDPPRPSVARQG